MTSMLVVIYLGFAAAGDPGLAVGKQYIVPTDNCVALAGRIRRNVKVGRIWTFCNPRS